MDAPFLEMLYNATTYHKQEEERRAKRAAEKRDPPSKVAETQGTRYCRILWKRQKKVGARRPLTISDEEGASLMHDRAVFLQDRVSFADWKNFYKGGLSNGTGMEDGEIDTKNASAGVKRSMGEDGDEEAARKKIKAEDF